MNKLVIRSIPDDSEFIVRWRRNDCGIVLAGLSQTERE